MVRWKMKTLQFPTRQETLFCASVTVHIAFFPADLDGETSRFAYKNRRRLSILYELISLDALVLLTFQEQHLYPVPQSRLDTACTYLSMMLQVVRLILIHSALTRIPQTSALVSRSESVLGC